MDAQPVSYAGFWKRFAAFFIDSIIVSIIEGILFIPVLAMFGITIFDAVNAKSSAQIVSSIIGLIAASLGWAFLAMIGSWLYHALMESSARGATVGKMALGIRVTDLHGNRVSFGRASGRYFARFLSSLILCIGYMMAGFTERKQALHDIVAGCLVVNI